MTDRRWQMGVGAVAGLVWLLGSSVIESRVSPPPAAAPAAPKTVRLYVFDCGLYLERDNAPAVYHLTRAQVADTRMSVPCFLIAHPKGTLMWDVGVIPDARIGENIGGAVATRTLASQLTEIGYQPADITYLAMSHGHRDHSANANDFAGSTWLTPLSERDFMFAGNNPRVEPAYYDKLKTSKTIIINTDEHDVFGDGKVVLKAASGHTPGHQVVVVKLAKSGTILLCGDLYHYPEERTLRAAPPNNEQGSVEQTAASRQKIEEYLVKHKAQMWIEHDFLANAKLKKSPGYYD